MKNYSLKAAAVAAAIAGSFALTGTANAGLTVDSVNGGAPTGVTLDNLDWLSLGIGGGLSPQSGMTVSFASDGGAVSGASSGIYAPPNLSGGNGNGFGPGNTNQANGPDTTTYVTAGGIQGSNVTFILPTDEKYFGLLWGSVDTYNTLTFYNSANVAVGMISGIDVTAAADGDQGAAGTYYVNITSSEAFNRVVGTSTQHAFEIDNIAFNPNVPTPEPITLSLFGAGLAGLGFARRRKA